MTCLFLLLRLSNVLAKFGERITSRVPNPRIRAVSRRGSYGAGFRWLSALRIRPVPRNRPTRLANRRDHPGQRYARIERATTTIKQTREQTIAAVVRVGRAAAPGNDTSEEVRQGPRVCRAL